MSTLRVVCLPGFADPVVGATWVANLSEAVPGVEVSALDWPGLWTRWGEPVSFTGLVDEATDAARDGAVLVGHSLGGLVALLVATRVVTRGVAAVCSPAVLGITRGEVARRWESTGVRPTQRAALNGMGVSFEIPAVFLSEVRAVLPEPVFPVCPTLCVFGEQDPVVSALDWDVVPRLGAEPAMVSVPGCPHRFMDVPACREYTVNALAGFVRSLAV